MILVGLSGGIDSAFTLWRLLEQGEAALVWHLHMHDQDHRSEAEAKAYRKIVAWLRDRGHHFDTIECSIDVTAIRRTTNPETLGWFTGAICRTRPDLAVAMCLSASDPAGRNPDVTWVARGRTIAEMVAHRPIDWRWPIAQLTKPQIIAAMPADLLALCWSCRRPNAGRPCRRCLTCRRLAQERAEATRL